ncbi:MAG TPA: ribonuclease H-like domain-containing protein [Verrucomicrobiae bacterium]|nr:ribonuclease H-like domain-containing protein [Verrucomicrobiae bacterium]
MLKNTFCHIPGLGTETERRLWSSGLHSWDAFRDGSTVPLAPAKIASLGRHLKASAAYLATGDARHFANCVPTDQHWRLYREFADSTAFLDIETTGLSGYSDHITTAVVYDGHHVRHYVHGANLRDFGREIRDYPLLVTYNGKTFDLPFIRASLGLPMDQAHIDLRYVLASLGYRGGLKSCERQLGLDRGGLADVDGFFAVLLWQEYKRTRNSRVLETLLAYNALDVLNLVRLMTVAYNLKLRGTPFEGTHKLPAPSVADNPFEADVDVIGRIRRRCR